MCVCFGFATLGSVCPNPYGRPKSLVWIWNCCRLCHLLLLLSFTSWVTSFGMFYCATVQVVAVLKLLTKTLEDAQHFWKHVQYQWWWSSLHFFLGQILLLGGWWCSISVLQKLSGRTNVSLLRCWLNTQPVALEVLEAIPAKSFPDFQIWPNFTSVECLGFMMGMKMNIYQNKFYTATLNIIWFFKKMWKTGCGKKRCILNGF